MVSKANLFSEAVFYCTLYLLLFKKKVKGYHFHQGLASTYRRNFVYLNGYFNFINIYKKNQNHLSCH